MRRRHVFIAVLVVLLAISMLLVSKIKFKYSQDHEGIFILKGENGAWLEVRDDVFPEETHRLLWSKTLNQMKDVNANGACVSFNVTIQHNLFFVL